MNNVTVIDHRSADFPRSFAKWPSRDKTLFMNFSRTPTVTKSDLSPDFATALKIFNNIAQAWGLNEQETRQLLGDDDLERISYVLGIYKALRTIFPTHEEAAAWPKKPNAAFGGRRALDLMLTDELSEVRRYLDGQCQ